MKKYLIIIIVSALFIASIPNTTYAESGSTQDQVSTTVINDQELNELADELDVDNTEDLDMSIDQASDEITVTTELDNPDIEATVDVSMDRETNELSITSEIEIESGVIEENSYNLIVKEIDDDNINFAMIDQETGEVFDINSSEISASVIPAIPIIVGFLARFGIKWIVKKFGKKAVKSAVKNLNKQLKKKSLGKGSTGRTTAKNLEEQIVMKSVLSNPLKGAKEILPSKKNDG